MAKRKRGSKNDRPKAGFVFAFARKVKHPGTKAQPYLRPAFDEVGTPILKLEIKKVLQTIRDLRSLTAALDNACKKAAAATLASAQQKVPVDKGGLKRSLNTRRRALMSYTVGTNIEYAAAVEFGTKPHPIVPVNAKVLRFEVKGS